MKLKSPLLDNNFFMFAILICSVFAVIILSTEFASAVTGSIGNAKMVLYPEVGFFGINIEKYILVKNVNEIPLNISLKSGGDIIGMVKFDEEAFVLQPNEEKKAYFTIHVSEPGNYDGRIDVFFTPDNKEEAGVVLSSIIVIRAEDGGFIGSSGEDDSELEDDEDIEQEDLGTLSGNETNQTNNKGFAISKSTLVTLAGLSSTALLVALVVILFIASKRMRNKKAGRTKIKTRRHSVFLAFSALLFLIILSASFASAESPRAAYVLKDVSNPDPNILNALASLNMTYTLIDDGAVTSTNFSNYGFIILGNQGIRNVPVNSYKSIFLDSYYRSGWSSSAGTFSSSQPILLNNDNVNSSITNGMLGLFQVYTSATSLTGTPLKVIYLSGRKYNDISRITSVAGNLGNFVVATRQNPRRVFFGAVETNYWTNTAKEMFKNSIQWVLSGDDIDGDGFYYDSDCNDNNPLINPNATEIAYNYLDDNCDGFDEADIDGDGYCKSSYIIQNKLLQCPEELSTTGTDCDDDDYLINPDAEELLDDINQNCINDAPVFSSNIANITMNEDSSISNAILLENYFQDPDGDSMTFGVYNTSSNMDLVISIDSEGNVDLTAKDDWNGVDFAVFRAVDSGGLSVLSNTVYITVTPVNDAPVIAAGSKIYALAGSNVHFTPNVTDADGDNISLTFYTPFNSTGDWQTSADNSGTFVYRVSASDGNGGNANGYFTVELIPKLTINEFVSNPSEGNDWVEIYNPSNNGFDLSDCYLEDLALNQKELNGTIGEKSFAVFEWSNRLNNDGDSIELICSNITVDSVTYGSGIDEVNVPGEGESAGRITDGLDTEFADDFKIYQYPTKGISNSADVILPSVILIAPENNLTIYTDSLYFNYTASDDTAVNLTCDLYSNINGEFSSLGSSTIQNGTSGIFSASNLEDGNYIWNIRCYDGYNYAFASSNLSFSISDSPYLVSEIPNQTAEEDTSISLNLCNYIGDYDNASLEYSLSGYEGMSANFSGCNATITSSQNWFGTSAAAFSACDNEKCTETNWFNVTINPVNDAPVLSPIAEINESAGHLLTLLAQATDAENDTITYSINDTRFVNNGNGNFSWQTSNPADIGVYYAEVSASDGILVSSQSVKMNVNAPSAPQIISFTPSSSIRILNNTLQNFSLQASDADDDLLSFFWFLNNIMSPGTNAFSNYFTNNGNYNVTAVVSDGLFNTSKQWDVFVGSTNDFTCSELNAFICLENQYCSGSVIDSSDDVMCCSISCTNNPFSDIDTCDIANSNIEITIDEPDNGEDFAPGEIIDGELKLRNNFEIDKELDLKVYLYDLTENDDVEYDKKKGFDVDASDSEEFEFSIIIPETITDGHKFALYAQATDSENDSICNSHSVEISIEREKHDLVIQNIKSNSDSDTLCIGSTAYFDVEIANLGKEDEEAYLKVENSALAISEKTEMFEISEFDESGDERTETISLNIPADAKEGSYPFIFSVVYNGNTESAEKNMELKQCPSSSISIVGTGSENQNAETTKETINLATSSRSSSSEAEDLGTSKIRESKTFLTQDQQIYILVLLLSTGAVALIVVIKALLAY